MSNEMLTSIAGFIFTIGMSLGISKTLTNRQDKEIEELKIWLKELARKLDEQKDEARKAFVSFDHFNEAITSLREIQRDMREDLKKILELITKRQRERDRV